MMPPTVSKLLKCVFETLNVDESVVTSGFLVSDDMTLE